MLFNVGLTFSPAAIMALDRMAIYSLEVVQRKRYSIMSEDGIIKPCLFVCWHQANGFSRKILFGDQLPNAEAVMPCVNFN